MSRGSSISVVCVALLFRGIFFSGLFLYVRLRLRGFFAAARPGIRAREYNGAGTVSGAHRDYGIKMRLRIHWILLSTAVVILAGSCNAATEVSTHLLIVSATRSTEREREREKATPERESASRGSGHRGFSVSRRPQTSSIRDSTNQRHQRFIQTQRALPFSL